MCKRKPVERRFFAVLALCLPLPAASAADFCASTDAGSIAVARIYDGATLAIKTNVAPFGSGFPGGARVACADFNGDGVPDLVAAAGAGGTPQVVLLDGITAAQLASFFAFDPGFSGGVHVAVGDVDGDGRTDIAVGAGTGGQAHVRVFRGAGGEILHSFFAYSVGFSGEVRVALGDVNGDGRADIVTGPGPGNASHVKVFDGSSGALIHSFFAYPSFTGGIFVAAGDVDGDGYADVVTGVDAGTAPHVKVFSGTTVAELASFFAFDFGMTAGVRVGAGDIDGNGYSDVLVASGSGATGHLRTFQAPTLTAGHSFFPFSASFTGGLFVAGPTARDVLFTDGFDGG